MVKEGGFKWPKVELFGKRKATEDPKDEKVIARSRVEAEKQRAEALAEVQRVRLESERESNKWAIKEAQMRAADAAIAETTAIADKDWNDNTYRDIARQMRGMLERLVIQGREKIYAITKPEDGVNDAMLREGLPDAGADPVEAVIKYNELIKENRTQLEALIADKRTAQGGWEEQIRALNEVRTNVLGTEPIGPNGEEVKEAKKKN